MSLLSVNLKRVREEAGIKQEEVAAYIGKSKGVVSNWELGINRPDADTISKLCEFFSVTPNDLFGWETKKAPPSGMGGDEEFIQLWNNATPEGQQAALVLLRGFQCPQQSSGEAGA